MNTFIIAEAGSCHDGFFPHALKLIRVAKQAGADACKFQYWSSAKRLAERRKAEAYFPIYSRYQVPEEWLPLLVQECRSNGIEFMCTVYLPEDIPTITPLVHRYKVASFEADDEEFVRAHDYTKEMIASTGMMTEIPLHLRRAHLLHCVSAYPCPPEQANLGVLQSRFYAGYSDHTKYVFTGAFAVCAGARMLEVHFRLHDTDPENPDYGTALDPKELSEYIALVRQAEQMLGEGKKVPMPAEQAMLPYRVVS